MNKLYCSLLSLQLLAFGFGPALGSSDWRGHRLIAVQGNSDLLTGWSTIANFEGVGIQNTDTFEVPAGLKVLIVWECRPRTSEGTTISGNFVVVMKNPNDDSDMDLVVNAIDSDSGRSRVYKNGTYYFSINSDEDWKICVLVHSATGSSVRSTNGQATLRPSGGKGGRPSLERYLAEYSKQTGDTSLGGLDQAAGDYENLMKARNDAAAMEISPLAASRTARLRSALTDFDSGVITYCLSKFQGTSWAHWGARVPAEVEDLLRSIVPCIASPGAAHGPALQRLRDRLKRLRGRGGNTGPLVTLIGTLPLEVDKRVVDWAVTTWTDASQ